MMVKMMIFILVNQIYIWQSNSYYLIENDCKLQFYYTDITVNLTNYEEPITSYINSLFLQINPTIFLKMNVFFMNYHLKNETKWINLTYKFWKNEK